MWIDRRLTAAPVKVRRRVSVADRAGRDRFDTRRIDPIPITGKRTSRMTAR
jgi:hypothetical protein